MNPPRVSVLVPLYNGGPFLAECLESILSQDYRDYELIVSDDGSTDDSIAVVKSYAAKDSRIRWWQNQQNIGQTPNHNLCLREARGEFMKFVHQDDKLLTAAAIQKMVSALTDHPTAVLVGSASDVIDEHSRVIDRRMFYRAGVWDGRQIIQAGFEAAANNLGEPSVVMFRKAHALRGFLSDYRQLWDLEMWYHLLEHGEFAYLAEPLCAFRQHSAQQSNVNRRSGIGPDEMLLLLETYYAKPWLRKIATQRMLINQARFLKKNRSLLGRRAEELLAEIKHQINPSSYPLYWLERKALRPFAKMKKALALKKALGRNHPI